MYERTLVPDKNCNQVPSGSCWDLPRACELTTLVQKFDRFQPHQLGVFTFLWSWKRHVVGLNAS